MIRLLVLLMVLGLAGCGKPPEVEVTQPVRGALEESFQERAETRLEEDYPVNLPVSGRIGRIDLEPGDKVSQGQLITQFDAFPVESEAEAAYDAVRELEKQLEVSRDTEVERAERRRAQESVESARKSLAAIDVQIQDAQLAVRQSERDLERTRNLVQGGALPPQQLEQARLQVDQSRLAATRLNRELTAARQRVDEARAGVKTFDSQIDTKLQSSQVVAERLAQARTRLERSQYEVTKTPIRSPIEGVVLERLVQGPRELPAGTPLVRLGRPNQQEIVCEVLSQDALRVEVGTRVELDPGGGKPTFFSQVKEIEPAGFTKLSSLGVEQQRVNVLISLPENAPKLGIAYELQARFITARKEDCLKIGRFSVLQEPDGGDYVFLVADGHLKKQPVELGLRGEREVEVLDGLTSDARLVKIPDVTMHEGDELTPISR
ncbi:MAG: HlyD family efflux transporter periplasmic adaptor subunit [Candidatus Eremiobacteraeota bacterium]|nr:HlyD family efflux transporter periplasmic adaptor subunit [Candidatus Eremiobacteraeota bacterium]